MTNEMSQFKIEDAEGNITTYEIVDAQARADIQSLELNGGTGTGTSGEDGATFTPSVDANGNLSWTNDKGLTNPTTVNIMGPAGENGEDGIRGTGIYTVTTAPSSYTTAVDGFTPKYRIALSTALSESGASEIIVGDTIRRSYYLYPVGYIDGTYAYSSSRASIRGATGAAGKTAYQYAQDGGYSATESEFACKLATPLVTPQMYGAVGDGVTDDTVAFQNALAANDNLFVPDGSYLITGTLDISYKKSLFSNDGQGATILYNGSGSVVNLGRMSVFRNINIVIKNAFSGIVFDTNNYDKTSGEPALGSRVEHVNVDFETESPNATLIGITVDSGVDANSIPRLTGVCFQTYNDIHVDNSSCAYGCGIKMEVIQGRAFTEETKEGFPWITHIDYDDISLGHPHTAIKSTATNTSGSDLFERVSIGHILFNNVYSQYLDSTSTQIFLDLDNFGGYFTKVMGWDYHPLTWAGEKVNKIGDNVTACISDCGMNFGDEFLDTCDFETETEYVVSDNPEYFINKYFNGTILSEGYDSIDAKIDTKLTSEYIANVAEERINEVLYSGYSNVMDDPLTQVKVGYRYSNSSQSWVSSVNSNTTVIIPIVTNGNIIRWTPSTYTLALDYPSAFFFNDDDLAAGIRITDDIKNLVVSGEDGDYIQVDNPSGYKYVSLPFGYYTDISADTMVLTINREITGNDSKSYTEYLRESVIAPAVTEEVENYAQPKGDYLTSYTETDPTVPAWAKATKKPTYTASEVGALSASDYTTKVMVVTYEDGTTETINLVVRA